MVVNNWWTLLLTVLLCNETRLPKFARAMQDDVCKHLCLNCRLYKNINNLQQ